MKKNITGAPRSMNMNVMQQLFLRGIKDNPHYYASKEIAISIGSDFFDRILEISGGGPFLIEDYRMGLLERGEVHSTVNLIDYHITAGQMVYIGRNSIIQIHSVSSGSLIKGVIIPPETVSRNLSDASLSLLSNSATTFHHEASSSDHNFFNSILQTLWTLIHHEGYPQAVLHSLLSALIHYYNHLYLSSNNLPKDTQGSASLFYRFISLVNEFSCRERSIPFYADRLCLSPRYFSTLIQEQSGNTAKYWIDTAVVTRAKIMLRHTPMTISQIATELHFPNDSFFCKFFRRLTGTSPTTFRHSK